MVTCSPGRRIDTQRGWCNSNLSNRALRQESKVELDVLVLSTRLGIRVQCVLGDLRNLDAWIRLD